MYVVTSVCSELVLGVSGLWMLNLVFATCTAVSVSVNSVCFVLHSAM